MKEGVKATGDTLTNIVLGDVIVGKHVFGNLYGIDKDVANDERELKDIVLKAVELSNTKLLDIRVWKLGGKKGGVSVIALVEESHIAIHTWIEYEYATVDVYTCGQNSNPWKAFNYIVSRLKPKYYTVNYADRSSIDMRILRGMST